MNALEFTDFQFLHPQYWLLLALLPVGIWYAARRVRRGTLRFSSTAPLARLRPTLRLRLRFVPALLRVLALVLLIVAMSRPQRGTELAPERSRGIGIMLVLDRSGSMRAEDFRLHGRPVSRIDAVKAVARDFIKGDGDELPGRPNDQIGIVAFAGYPVPVAPLTLDHGAVLEVLAAIEVADPRQAERDARGQVLYPEEYETAIGDALALAAQRLRDTEVKSRVAILISDGSQTMGELAVEEGAEIARAFGIKVYTVGIGSSGDTLARQRDPLFGVYFSSGRTEFDERALRKIAEVTGGKYFYAGSTGALRDVYAEIDRLERSEISSPRFRRWDERFAPLALAGLGCIVLEILLSQTVFRRLP